MRIAETLAAAEFCRDWRNRHIAHRNLSLVLHGGNPLKQASRLKVAEAITALGAVLNAVSLHYLDSTTWFEHDSTSGGALALLHVLDLGVAAEGERRERRRSGKYDPREHQQRDL